MSSATETLCAQAYGAGQYHMLGIYLHRSWIVDLITTTILLLVFIFGTSIFKILSQKEDIYVATGNMSLLYIPLMYSFVFTLIIQMYLQAQQKNTIVAWMSIFRLVIHVPLLWLFAIVLNMGVSGAMASLSISTWISLIIYFVYIFGGWFPQIWKGFTIAAFKDLWPIVKLSISSRVMICINFHGWDFLISLGFLGASCVRVENELGRGYARALKFSIKVISATSIII